MEHKAASFEVPELERTLAKRKKRYVNYKEGMALTQWEGTPSASWQKMLTHSSA